MACRVCATLVAWSKVSSVSHESSITSIPKFFNLYILIILIWPISFNEKSFLHQCLELNFSLQLIHNPLSPFTFWVLWAKSFYGQAFGLCSEFLYAGNFLTSCWLVRLEDWFHASYNLARPMENEKLRACTLAHHSKYSPLVQLWNIPLDVPRLAYLLWWTMTKPICCNFVKSSPKKSWYWVGPTFYEVLCQNPHCSSFNNWNNNYVSPSRLEEAKKTFFIF